MYIVRPCNWNVWEVPRICLIRSKTCPYGNSNISAMKLLVELLQYGMVNKMLTVTWILLVQGFRCWISVWNYNKERRKVATCLWLWSRNKHVLQSHCIWITSKKESQKPFTKFYQRHGLRLWKQRLIAFTHVQKSAGHWIDTMKHWTTKVLTHVIFVLTFSWITLYSIHWTDFYSWLFSFKTISELAVWTELCDHSLDQWHYQFDVQLLLVYPKTLQRPNASNDEYRMKLKVTTRSVTFRCRSVFVVNNAEVSEEGECQLILEKDVHLGPDLGREYYGDTE
jgi:hypothetical protein